VRETKARRTDRSDGGRPWSLRIELSIALSGCVKTQTVTDPDQETICLALAHAGRRWNVLPRRGHLDATLLCLKRLARA
jgi:hypothetical protein